MHTSVDPILNYLRQAKLAQLIRDCAPHSIYLVGGAVRDLLLGVEPKDPDFAVSCSAQTMMTHLESKGYRVVPTGLQHSTIMVVLETLSDETLSVEFTTFGASGGQASTVESIEYDLSKRDFTINAIAFDLNKEVLIDPFSGQRDLASKILKAVDNPEKRFSEDPLRLLRMLRFGPASGRSIEEGTLDAAYSMADSLASVKVERVRSELEKILISPHPSPALELMQKLDLLKIVLPEALASVGFEQNDYHVEDVWKHTLTVVSRSPATLRLRLAALFHDLGKPASLSVAEDGRRHFFRHEIFSADLANQAMTRLKFSEALTKEVTTLVAMHMRPLTCGETAVRRIMRELGDLIEDWKLFKEADATPTLPLQEHLDSLEYFNHLHQKELNRKEGSVFSRLAIDGNDLIALGFKEGPALGSTLKQLSEHVLENPDNNNRDSLIKLAKENLCKSI